MSIDCQDDVTDELLRAHKVPTEIGAWTICSLSEIKATRSQIGSYQTIFLD